MSAPHKQGLLELKGNYACPIQGPMERSQGVEYMLWILQILANMSLHQNSL